MNKNIAIKVQNLTKTYKLYSQPIDRLKESLHPFKKQYHKDFYALNDVSFEIKKGETVGIIGKNGSGKSTLLKIITGVLTPTGGRVTIHGKISAILELGAGFNPEMTGLENIYLNTSINGMSKAQTDKKLDEIIAFAELGEFIYQPTKIYSSGMKARLAFAVSINIEPNILIVDEALSVGDAAFARKCFAKIEDMCKNDETTVLFVSHSGTAIKQLCNRAIMLYNGKKVLDGKAKNVVNLYEKFLGSKSLDIQKLQKEFLAIGKNSKGLNFKKQTISNYSENLKSKSMTVYEQNGAMISDPHVEDINGNRCNILDFEEYYYYVYKIDFHDDIDKVNVAMFIKNEHGLPICGKDMPLGDVRKNQSYLIKWKFKNIFNENYYFFNCGVNSTNFGQKIVHHRIVDAYMIKCIKDEKNYSHGIVDISIELEKEVMQ